MVVNRFLTFLFLSAIVAQAKLQNIYDSDASHLPEGLVPDFSFNSLSQDSSHVIYALREVGYISVSNFPGMEALTPAFAKIKKCVRFSGVKQRTPAGGDSENVVRYSIASSTVMGKQNPWDFGLSTTDETDRNHCRYDMENVVKEMRSAAHDVAFKLIQTIEKSLQGDSATQGRPSSKSLTQYLFSEGEHLEHVHLYLNENPKISIAETTESVAESFTSGRKTNAIDSIIEPAKEKIDEAEDCPSCENKNKIDATSVPGGVPVASTVTSPFINNTDDHSSITSILTSPSPPITVFQMHVDAGLLLCMTSAHDPSIVDVTLSVLDQNGRKVKLDLAALENKFFCLGGSGWSTFMEATGTPPIRAVPHRVDFKYRPKESHVSEKIGQEILEGEPIFDDEGLSEEQSRAWFGIMLLPPPGQKFLKDASNPHSPVVTFHTLMQFAKRRNWAAISSLACVRNNNANDTNFDGLYRISQFENDISKEREVILKKRFGKNTVLTLPQGIDEVGKKYYSQEIQRYSNNGDNPNYTLTNAGIGKSECYNLIGESQSDCWASDQAKWLKDQSTDVQISFAEMHAFTPEEALEVSDACHSHGGHWCWFQCQFNDEDAKKYYEKDRTNAQTSHDKKIFSIDSMLITGESLTDCSNKNIRCYSPGRGKFKDGLSKDCGGNVDCQITCNTRKLTPSGNPDDDAGRDSDDTAFCFGGTDMFMNGFQSLIFDHSAQCLVFLHRSLIMNTRWKFYLGVFTAIAIGILAEVIIMFRRNLHQKIKNSSQVSLYDSNRLRYHETILYGVNVTLGYIVMLIAMMYSFELFLCTIFGLTLGHLIFNFSAPPTESLTVCCTGENNTVTADGTNDTRSIVNTIESEENENAIEICCASPNATDPTNNATDEEDTTGIIC